MFISKLRHGAAVIVLIVIVFTIVTFQLDYMNLYFYQNPAWHRDSTAYLIFSAIACCAFYYWCMNMIDKYAIGNDKDENAKKVEKDKIV